MTFIGIQELEKNSPDKHQLRIHDDAQVDRQTAENWFRHRDHNTCEEQSAIANFSIEDHGDCARTLDNLPSSQQ